MITLTDNAKSYLTATTEKHGKKYAYLSVLGGGCSGFQYEWSMTDETEKGTLIEDILVYGAIFTIPLFISPQVSDFFQVPSKTALTLAT